MDERGRNLMCNRTLPSRFVTFTFILLLFHIWLLHHLQYSFRLECARGISEWEKWVWTESQTGSLLRIRGRPGQAEMGADSCRNGHSLLLHIHCDCDSCHSLFRMAFRQQQLVKKSFRKTEVKTYDLKTEEAYNQISVRTIVENKRCSYKIELMLQDLAK